jgi:hypothetical protein
MRYLFKPAPFDATDATGHDITHSGGGAGQSSYRFAIHLWVRGIMGI